MQEAKRPTSDELALERTVMAADRTLMAWTRTALSLISFGFTIYKFLQYTREEGTSKLQMGLEGPQHMGMAMIGLGIVFLLLSAIQFWRDMKRLEPLRRFSPWRLSLALALLLALVGMLALANVALRVGPF
jgi:putative membrane protein